eukprot:TRINITY_DN3421_c0_g1_i2.p1 TRINITY_DN3421_c0_g1~~TRINITY_DN3421_c0_g1_i2.p1  ORF type:complete len:154 (-),score=31.87 TRINITY_DN3421_c0_g1_i2:24-485(-)
MSEITLTVGPDFGLVIFAGFAKIFVGQILSGFVSSARKKYNIAYPQLYAWVRHDGETKEDKEGNEFNQVQRGHQNSIETASGLVFLLIVVGLFYPKYAAACGFLDAIGRLAYGIGYSKSPKMRYVGSLMFLPATLGLWGGALYLGYKLYSGSL